MLGHFFTAEVDSLADKWLQTLRFQALCNELKTIYPRASSLPTLGMLNARKYKDKLIDRYQKKLMRLI